jgi:hypothetical protein
LICTWNRLHLVPEFKFVQWSTNIKEHEGWNIVALWTSSLTKKKFGEPKKLCGLISATFVTSSTGSPGVCINICIPCSQTLEPYGGREQVLKLTTSVGSAGLCGVGHISLIWPNSRSWEGYNEATISLPRVRSDTPNHWQRRRIYAKLFATLGWNGYKRK